MIHTENRKKTYNSIKNCGCASSWYESLQIPHLRTTSGRIWSPRPQMQKKCWQILSTCYTEWSTSNLEPVDISRDDNQKRVDGVTIIPWSHGRQLAWDATCVDPVCATYVRGSCFEANRAAVKKRNDYRTVCNLYHFVAFAVDCFGGWSKEAQIFGIELGKRMSRNTGETRSLSFFRQRVSIAIQRGNSASVLGTISSGSSLDEIY